jgi:hypothetical protein
MVETIKQNPLPAAVAALSLGWLWTNRSRGGTASPVHDAVSSYYGTGYSHGTGRMDGEDSQRSGISNVADRVGETVGQARDAAGQMLNTAGQAAGDVASGAGYLAGTVAGGAGQMAGSAGGAATDVGSSMIDIIARNPLPAALTGIGLAWLWMNRTPDGHRPSYAHSGSHAWQGNADRPTASSASSSPGAVAGQVQDAAGQMVDQAQGAAGQVAGRVADAAGQIVGESQYRVGRAGGRLQQMMEENPLLIGTVAAAAGLAVGLATPSTERENELMGQAREDLVRRAQDTAQETLEKVQQVAGDAGDAALKSAAEQKLTV